ncbi:hamartin-like [Palaemon carinicauda]|uniref:hamartin-like n=1 Tax=Palaemon carinicauda TaxID=392227 RepID=UPI0035B5F965
MEEVRDRDVGDVLGLLESPQEEVVQEVRSILKDTLATTREGWLITGLLEYFFVSNSGRLLDIVLGVTEPHDRHLLERIAEGLKRADRFRYTCLLLYAVRRQPPPMWLRKLLNHGAMRELLHTLAVDEDVPVLVSGVMALVMLLPVLPLEMGRLHLSSVLDIFCRLVRWTPKMDKDESFQPYLQVAVYSLFHRLYALYPCHFITCLQNTFTKPGSSPCFFTTLKPMMESVRLHPVLITENRETELAKSRWMHLETHQLIQECSKLCIDPSEATCEEAVGANFSLGSGNEFDSLPIPTNWMVSASGNNFWSPSLAHPSPGMTSSSRGSTSVPHTPVFPILTPNHRPASKVAESPPEAAVEATPETTPFTSPLKMEDSSTVSRRSAQSVRALTPTTLGNVDSLSSQTGDADINCSPLSPLKKDQTPFRFPDKQNQDFIMRAERNSILSRKLQEIQRERQQISRDSFFSQSMESENKDEDCGVDVPRESVLFFKSKSEDKSGEISESGQEMKDDSRAFYADVSRRRRKISVYDGSRHVDMSQLPITRDVSNGNIESDSSNEVQKTEGDSTEPNFTVTSIIDRRISEEKESEESESRRSSDEPRIVVDKNSNEAGSFGLGVPSQKSMTDIVKNVRTMRLRFLSQCGPPPDLSQYKLTSSVRGTLSPTKSSSIQNKILQKSTSCPHLATDDSLSIMNGIEVRVRKESAMSSLTLSPTRQAVVTNEATTQTEEVNVINPYEQLLDALVSGPTHGEKTGRTKNDIDTSDIYSPSPHKLLDEYIRQCNETSNGTYNIWQQQCSSTAAEGLKGQVRLMQTMLLLERYKREVHAERNRRLLGKAKKVYALEEEQQGLRNEVRQLEDEIIRLKHDLHNLQLTSANKEQQLQSALNQQQGKLSQVCVDRDSAQQDRDLFREQCKTLSKENEALIDQLHTVQATLLERERQLTVQARLAEDNNSLRHQVEILHKQMTLMGEVQDQYKHEVWKMSMSGQGSNAGVGLERVTAQRQVEELENANRITNIKLDAAIARVSELEQELSKKDKLVSDHQKELRAAREAGLEQCRAVERRCQALAATNQTLESYILEHNDRIDRLVRQVRRSQRGKSVCSDGFDIDLELSASPSSASGSSAATSPPDDPLLSRQPIALNRLDALAELELEPEGRRKT